MTKARIRVYTVPGCLDCTAVKALLRQADVAFEEVDVSDIPNSREALALLSGLQSVPQVYLDGRFIGQVAEVRHLVMTGRLSRLLADRS